MAKAITVLAGVLAISGTVQTPSVVDLPWMKSAVDRQTVFGAGSCPPQLKKLKPVHATFHPVTDSSRTTGWKTAHEAALAFYAYYDEAYHDTGELTELVGFLLRNEIDRYFFTNAVEVPIAFKLTASIVGAGTWKMSGMLHTHPGGRRCQEEFSVEDRETVFRGTISASYLRTPKGRVRYLDRRLAKRTWNPGGAKGRSICPKGRPCLSTYGSPGDPSELLAFQLLSPNTTEK